MITVNQLIDALQKLPPELMECPVMTESEEGGYNELKLPSGAQLMRPNNIEDAQWMGPWLLNDGNLHPAQCIKAIIL